MQTNDMAAPPSAAQAAGGPMGGVLADPWVICPKRRLRAAAAALFGIPEHLLCGASRRRIVVRARYAFAYVARQRWPSIAYRRLGNLLGGRDHSTIIHGLAQFGEWLARDPDLQAKVAALLAASHKPVGDGGAVWDVPEQVPKPIASPAPSSAGMAADALARVETARAVRPANRLSPDDHDALRRKAASDALGQALAAAGGWR